MATDQQLMGLGLAPALASRLADATGNINVTAGTGSAPLAIRGNQFLTYFNAPTAGGNATFPAVGGSDNSASQGDAFTMFNDTSGPLTLGLSAGVTLSIGGNHLVGSVAFTLAPQHFVEVQAISTTQWIGASV